MKKFLVLFLAIFAIFALSACGNDNEPLDSDMQSSDVALEGSDSINDDTSTDDTSAEDTDPADMTMGAAILADFKERMNNNPNVTALELAEALLTNEVIEFMGGAMPVEPGSLLLGFGETEVTGYKEGAMFGPMMGSIAFVGYIFNLEEGADIEAFKTFLADNCDPRWNICVTADETFIENIGNTVFFLMSPIPEEYVEG